MLRVMNISALIIVLIESNSLNFIVEVHIFSLSSLSEVKTSPQIA